METSLFLVDANLPETTAGAKAYVIKPLEQAFHVAELAEGTLPP